MTNPLYILLLSGSLLIAASDTTELDRQQEASLVSSGHQTIADADMNNNPSIETVRDAQRYDEQPCKYDPIAFLADHEKEAAFVCAALLILGLWIR